MVKISGIWTLNLTSNGVNMMIIILDKYSTFFIEYIYSVALQQRLVQRRLDVFIKMIKAKKNYSVITSCDCLKIQFVTSVYTLLFFPYLLFLRIEQLLIIFVQIFFSSCFSFQRYLPYITTYKCAKFLIVFQSE